MSAVNSVLCYSYGGEEACYRYNPRTYHCYQGSENCVTHRRFQEVWLLAETENSQKGFIDSPLLFGADSAYQASETSGVDRAYLLDENPCDLAEYVDLWAERGGSGTARCRRNQHNGPGQEFVGLDYDAKALPLLFVTLTARHAEFMDVTPEHEGSP